MHDHHEHHHHGDHDHEHYHTHTHEHTHEHPHEHEHLHEEGHAHHHHHHDHDHACDGQCGGCAGGCEHTPMEELMALMQYMAKHNAAHANELAGLAQQLKQAGNAMAFEQVMAAVSDYEKGNLRLQAVLASLEVK